MERWKVYQDDFHNCSSNHRSAHVVKYNMLVTNCIRQGPLPFAQCIHLSIVNTNWEHQELYRYSDRGLSSGCISDMIEGQ